MAYNRESSGAVVLEGGKPNFNEIMISRHKNTAPERRVYWENLIAFDAPIHEYATSSEKSPDEICNHMKRTRENKSNTKAAKQREAYGVQRRSLKRKKIKREKEQNEREDYKEKALLANLKTQEQNATCFHDFTTEFCSVNIQAPPAPIFLPKLPEIPAIIVDTNDDGNGDGIEEVASEYSESGSEEHVENEGVGDGAR